MHMNLGLTPEEVISESSLRRGYYALTRSEIWIKFSVRTCILRTTSYQAIF